MEKGISFHSIYYRYFTFIFALLILFFYVVGKRQGFDSLDVDLSVVKRDTARFVSATRYELKKECAVLRILFPKAKRKDIVVLQDKNSNALLLFISTAKTVVYSYCFACSRAFCTAWAMPSLLVVAPATASTSVLCFSRISGITFFCASKK